MEISYCDGKKNKLGIFYLVKILYWVDIYNFGLVYFNDWNMENSLGKMLFVLF